MRTLKNWRYHYDVGKLVRDGEPEKFKEIAQQIYTALHLQNGFRNPTAEMLLHNLAIVNSVDEFDSAWDEIYDYADREQIWLGV